jgi:acetyl esterase/lipase
MRQGLAPSSAASCSEFLDLGAGLRESLQRRAINGSQESEVEMKRRATSRMAGALGLCGLLLAFAATAASDAATASYTLYKNVSYASPVGSAHTMYVYVPIKRKGPFPVILHQAGSAFGSDNTINQGGGPGGLGGGTTAASLAQMWASKGFVIVGYNTRSSSQAKFPAQLYDVKAAIRFLRAHASKYRIDPKHVGIMGTSSGSWTAEMAGLTTGVKRLEGNLGNAKQSSSCKRSSICSARLTS